MQIRFYIKDGVIEKGPLTVQELKKLGIKKKDQVRYENHTTWAEAKNFIELKKILNRKKRRIIIVLLIFFFFIISSLALIVINEERNNSYSDSDNWEEIIDYEEPLPKPPTINVNLSVHHKNGLIDFLKDCNIKGNKRRLVEACDFKNAILRNYAVSIAGNNAGEFNLGQICDVFDHCYKNWKYVNDPIQKEIYGYASNSILNGLNGDCDDFAILVCSMILAIGGEARINFAFNSTGEGHAFTEVNIGQTNVDEYISKRFSKSQDFTGVWTRVDAEGNHWLNLDWQASYPGGKYFEYTHGTTFNILQKFCEEFNN